MSRTLLRGAAVLTATQAVAGRCVVCEGGHITAVLPEGDVDAALGDTVHDFPGCLIAPGYIDLHIHGLAGQLAEAGPAQLARMCELLPQHGVTGFLPAITPGPDDAALLASLAGERYTGSRVLGFFMEGHFLALAGGIAHLPQTHTLQGVQALQQAAQPYRLAFAVSPELDGLQALLPAMAAGGFTPFITHTQANARQTECAIELGARHATHFYDVFPYPGDVEPGVRGCGAVEAVLADARVTVDFILDGEHVDPAAVRMALACKGPGGVCLVTDANTNAGLPPGCYTGLGGTKIEMARRGAPARMAAGEKTPGQLVGSGLTMDVAVQNAVDLLGLPVPQAVRMATLNPAGVLGLAHKGRIEAGCDADFAVLNPDLSVRACFVAADRRF